MAASEHKAGFISILGKPNVGKSSLMNQLVGEKLSIITSKAQTTRHRIFGIMSGDDFQVVFSDTPGVLHPKYALQNSMMRFVYQSFEDADVVLFVTDLYEKMDEEMEEVLERLSFLEVPVILVLNKLDLAKGSQAVDKMAYWEELVKPTDTIITSAMTGEGVPELFSKILHYLPVHPPYFDKDTLTDKSERFFAAEIIREKIFQNYKKEVPYSCEVVVTEFKEEEDIIRIRAEIYVERQSQKGIIIGKGGEALKKVGMAARQDMETFFGKQVFLETFVKVSPDWRKNERQLKRFGYKE